MTFKDHYDVRHDNPKGNETDLIILAYLTKQKKIQGPKADLGPACRVRTLPYFENKMVNYLKKIIELTPSLINQRAIHKWGLNLKHCLPTQPQKQGHFQEITVLKYIKKCSLLFLHAVFCISLLFNDFV